MKGSKRKHPFLHFREDSSDDMEAEEDEVDEMVAPSLVCRRFDGKQASEHWSKKGASAKPAPVQHLHIM